MKLIALNWIIGTNTKTGKPHNMGEFAAFNGSFSESQIKLLYERTKHRYGLPRGDTNKKAL